MYDFYLIHKSTVSRNCSSHKSSVFFLYCWKESQNVRREDTPSVTVRSYVFKGAIPLRHEVHDECLSIQLLK